MKIWTTVITFFLLTACANADTKNNLNDICGILKLTINLPKLQQYYHVDKKPERKPLRLLVFKQGLNCRALKKFGSPVIVSDSMNLQFPYLQVYKINFEASHVEVKFEYREEGIKGRAMFKMVKKKWTLVTENIVEI